MKKLYIILILACFKMAAQTLNIPDAAFKNILLNASASNTTAKDLSGNYFKIDSNSDGQIEVSEALQVKELKVNYTPSVLSIEGILSFTNMESLELGFLSNLGSVNVSGLTALKKLSVINCYIQNNINVTGCTAIEDFYCCSLAATQIDFSTLTNLKNLACWSNSLVNLDLSNNHILQTLNAVGNSTLQSINIQNGSIETSINIDCYSAATTVCCDAGDYNLVMAERMFCGINAFTVNQACLLSAETPQDANAVIYPNPVDNVLNINTVTPPDDVLIIDLNGRILKPKLISGQSVDTSELSPGIYICIIHSGTTKSSVKFLKI